MTAITTSTMIPSRAANTATTMELLPSLNRRTVWPGGVFFVVKSEISLVDCGHSVVGLVVASVSAILKNSPFLHISLISPVFGMNKASPSLQAV